MFFRWEGSMGVIVKCALLAVSVVWTALLALLLSADVANADSGSWTGRATVSISQFRVSSLSPGAETCSAHILPIIVEGESSVFQACVYGKFGGLQLARYFNSEGQLVYAVAYPSDSRFVVVRGFCTGMMRCAYSQAEDVLIMEELLTPWQRGSIVVPDFSKYLKRYSDMHRFYQFEYPGERTFLGAAGTHRYATGTVAISSNGRWGLVELKGYGIARLDLRTLELRRVVPLASGYSLNQGLLLELAISDDGSKVVLAGRGVALTVVEVNDTCGDAPGVTETPDILPGFTRCSFGRINTSSLFSQYQMAQAPKFSVNGMKLSLYVTTNQGVQATTLTPQGYTAANPLYLAFGDSFTSGEGETDSIFYTPSTNTAENRCHVSTRSYPFLIGSQWEIETRSLACSGSRTTDVLNAKSKILQDSPGQSASAISVGIGGNNIDLVGKLKSCLGLGTCDWAEKSRRIVTANEIKSLLPLITETILELREGFTGAPVFVVGYPTIISPDRGASCGPLIDALITRDEREYMNETIQYLNTVLGVAAAYAKAHFIDTSSAFIGQRLCEGDELAMNSIRHGKDIAPIPLLQGVKFIGSESFHPTPYGHSQIVATSNNSLDAFWSSPYCESCHPDTSLLTPGPYWGTDVDGRWLDVRLLAMEFLGSSQLVAGERATFSLPIDTFAPESVVELELHSTVRELGSFTAGSDGSLIGNIDIPADVYGYHTVHAIGEGVSGESIDVYQTIYIENNSILTTDTPPVSSETPKQTESTAVNKERAVLSSQYIDNPEALDILGVTSSDAHLSSQNNVANQADSVKHETKDEQLQAPWLVGVGTIFVVICAAAICWQIYNRRRRLSG